MQMAADQNFSLSDRTPQRSDGLHPAHHVVLDAGPVCLSELFHGLAVAEHCQSLPSSDSRSSGLMRTAAGEPLRVMTTRSWWALTRSMNSEKRSRTVRSDSLAMGTIVPHPWAG